MKQINTLKINEDTFRLSGKIARKHEAVKFAKKLHISGFNVRIKQQNPYLIYKSIKKR